MKENEILTPGTGIQAALLRWSPHLLTIGFAAAILAVYSSYFRPIWYDEYIQFSFCSLRSIKELWKCLAATAPYTKNTGVYIMINYWTLNTFGASRMLLRLPSLLSGALLLFSFLRLADRLKFGFWWTILLLVSLLGLPALMYYAGEARQYMPLAAAVAGMFACYLQPWEERGKSDRILGAVAIMVGVLFHSYFGLYWMVLALLTFLKRPAGVPVSARMWLHAFIRHCEPWVAFPAAAVFFLLGRYSWLLSGRDVRFDPFEYIPAPRLLDHFFSLGHFQFLGGWWFGGPCLVLLAGVFLRRRRSGSVEAARQRAVTAIQLITTALALSVVIACISYSCSYWILSRQWVASFGLVCFGFVWLMRECFVVISEERRKLGMALAAAFALLLFCSMIPRIKGRVDAHGGTVAAAQARDSNATAPSMGREHPAGQRDWVSLANANLDAGGPVWPVFRESFVENGILERGAKE